MAPENRPLEVWRFLLETIIFRGEHVSFREGINRSARIIATSTDVNPNYDLSSENKGVVLVYQANTGDD